MNAVEREPVETRVLNPIASEASYRLKKRSYRLKQRSYRPKQRSYRTKNLKKKIHFLVRNS